MINFISFIYYARQSCAYDNKRTLCLEETRNHDYKRKVDVPRFKIGCKIMQISFLNFLFLLPFLK